MTISQRDPNKLTPENWVVSEPRLLLPTQRPLGFLKICKTHLPMPLPAVKSLQEGTGQGLPIAKACKFPLSLDLLNLESANCFCKRQNSKHFRLCRCDGPVAATHLSLSSKPPETTGAHRVRLCGDTYGTGPGPPHPVPSPQRVTEHGVKTEEPAPPRPGAPPSSRSLQRHPDLGAGSGAYLSPPRGRQP